MSGNTSRVSIKEMQINSKLTVSGLLTVKDSGHDDQIICFVI